MHPAVIINMLLHGIMSIEPKSEITEEKNRQDGSLTKTYLQTLKLIT
jgi:hypothetical protein